MRSGTTLAALIRSVPTDDDRCELCAGQLPTSHRHVLDMTDNQPHCVCRACSLLFEREAAGGRHYRLIPERRRRLDTDSDVHIGVPVGLAFITRSADGGVTARYPSPVGATSWDFDADQWTSLVERWPELAGLEPEVEALLLHTARGRREFWIVPIDDCYRLVATVRRHWQGLAGGREVWPAVDRFFAKIAEGNQPWVSA